MSYSSIYHVAAGGQHPTAIILIIFCETALHFILFIVVSVKYKCKFESEIDKENTNNDLFESRPLMWKHTQGLSDYYGSSTGQWSFIDQQIFEISYPGI